MFVPNLAKAGIVKLAERIVLNATARPMIHCFSKPLAAAVPHDDLPALAALLGHRRDPAMRSESIVIPLGERIRGLREETRGDEVPESRQREK